MISDTLITCNVNSLTHAYTNRTYKYIFSIPPGVHSQDIKYTFWNGDTPLVNETIARDLQGWITRFAETGGDPNASWLPRFVRYGVDGNNDDDGGWVMDLSEGGVRARKDEEGMERRCAFWRQLLG